ncbi:unnamed protein product [Owenia fusiformis]|uniref:Mitochondrial import receptor subunit TOM22 homolog n=1 Tax=Owenia fusiformis TaxID=6347 RepID=A0A8J1UAB1_OWEFU|nr:unnamed protein product [Owenia fusiformis]
MMPEITEAEVSTLSERVTDTNPTLALEEDDEDIEDETLIERLIGLTEMFPESLRNTSSSLVDLSWNGTKWLYSNSRSLMWVCASSATMLALPVMFEMERSQMEEQQLQQQRQIMLGPNAAMSGRPGQGMMPPMPGQPQH